MDSQPKHILVAEDEDAVREFVTRGLTHAGYKIKAVVNGVEALQALKKEPFDLLVTDIVMPYMDGISLALQAGDEFPDMPILMMTGYGAERQRAYNLEALIHDVLSKPFTLEQICDAVARALAGKKADS